MKIQIRQTVAAVVEVLDIKDKQLWQIGDGSFFALGKLGTVLFLPYLKEKPYSIKNIK